MPRRKGYLARKIVKRPTRKDKVARLVNGKDAMTAPERIVKKGGSWLSAIPSIVSTIGTFASLINSEGHRHDEQNNGAFDDAGTVYRLTNIAQGDTERTRTGNSILGKEMTVKFAIYRNGSNTQISNICRVLLLVDKENNGSNPALTDVLENVSLTLHPLNPLKTINTKRFTILKHALISLNTAGVSSKTYKWYVPTPFHVKYSAGSSAIADARENQIYLMFLSDQATGSNPPNQIFKSRFKFHDN